MQHLFCVVVKKILCILIIFKQINTFVNEDYFSFVAVGKWKKYTAILALTTILKRLYSTIVFCIACLCIVKAQLKPVSEEIQKIYSFCNAQSKISYIADTIWQHSLTYEELKNEFAPRMLPILNTILTQGKRVPLNIDSIIANLSPTIQKIKLLDFERKYGSERILILFKCLQYGKFILFTMANFRSVTNTFRFSRISTEEKL